MPAASATRPIAAPRACCTPTARRPGRSPRISSACARSAIRGCSSACGGGARGDRRRRAAAAAAALLRRALAEPPPPGRAGRPPARGGAGGGQRRPRDGLRAAGGGARRSRTTRASAPRSRSSSPRPTRRCSAGWTRSTSSSGRWRELGDGDAALAARLEGELVVSGLHDARRAARVAPVLDRLASRSPRGRAAEALGGRAGHGGARRPAGPQTRPRRRSSGARPRRARRRELGHARRAALDASSRPSGSTPSRPRSSRCSPRSSAPAARAASSPCTARSACSSCASGALPEADAAARVALARPAGGRLRAGLAFAATVLADVAVEAGELDEAEALLDLLPQDGWPPGVGTVLIPAARGRLRLAQGRPAEALADFETCAAMFSSERWGTEMRDVGYVHARSGAALALLRLGRARARPRAGRGRARRRPRVRGTARARRRPARRRARAGGERGLACWATRWPPCASSPALLERAHVAGRARAPRCAGPASAPRRASRSAEALDLAARCGAPPARRPRARGARRGRRPAAPRVAHRRGGADARASCGSRGWPRGAGRTARSPTSST